MALLVVGAGCGLGVGVSANTGGVGIVFANAMSVVVADVSASEADNQAIRPSDSVTSSQLPSSSRPETSNASPCFAEAMIGWVVPGPARKLAACELIAAFGPTGVGVEVG